ncbi:MAG: hypothetical protein V4772_03660, partial [Pseudomonadota bacterium]
MGDATGLDSVADFARASDRAGQRFANKTQAGKTSIAGFAPGSVVQALPAALEDVAVSIGSQIPALATGSLPASLAVMGVQSAGTQYGKLKDQGTAVLPALANAALTGAAEVIGERLGGMPGTIRALRGALAGNAPARVAADMLRAGVRDLPGEQLTTALQYATDAAPGIGSNEQASLADYLEQAKKTAVQTVLQGGLMTGGNAALAAAARKPGARPAEGQLPPPLIGQVESPSDAIRLDRPAILMNEPSAKAIGRAQVKPSAIREETPALGSGAVLVHVDSPYSAVLVDSPGLAVMDEQTKPDVPAVSSTGNTQAKDKADDGFVRSGEKGNAAVMTAIDRAGTGPAVDIKGSADMRFRAPEQQDEQSNAMDIRANGQNPPAPIRRSKMAEELAQMDIRLLAGGLYDPAALSPPAPASSGDGRLAIWSGATGLNLGERS